MKKIRSIMLFFTALAVIIATNTVMSDISAKAKILYKSGDSLHVLAKSGLSLRVKPGLNAKRLLTINMKAREMIAK